MFAALDPASTVVVVSDLHIGDGAATEPFARKDDLLRGFLDRVAARADALVIAGDGFDLAQAFSLARIYARHRRLLDDLCDLARSLPVYYLQGNHDGSAVALATLLPFRYAPALGIGPRIRIEHGHRFDPRNQPGDTLAFWGARAHALLERAIRSPVRIPMRKHYLWSTRLGHWLFFRYGRYRLLKARLNDLVGRTARAAHHRGFLDYWGQGEWGDVHALLPGAESMLAAQQVDTLVCGHSHTPGLVAFPVGRYVNTGSWTYADATYACYEQGRFVVRRWPENQAIGDEEYRGVLGPHRGKSFFDWWDAFYLGRFRYDVAAMNRAAAGLVD